MQVEFFDGRLKRGQQSDGEPDAAGGLQDVNPATHALQGAREVSRTAFQKILPVGLPDDFARPIKQHFGGNRLTQRAQRPTDAQRRRQTGFQVQIAGALLLGCRDQVFQIHEPVLLAIR